MTTPIILQRFSRNDQDLFREYLKIKFDVFVTEQGWTGLRDGADRVAREDDYDAKGTFFLAQIASRATVGCIRGIALTAGFPHADLFEHHFRCPDVSAMYPQLGTINSLAVLPPYRQLECEDIERDSVGGVGTLLTLKLCHVLEEQGLRAAIATAEGPLSTSFFRRCGFYVIDRPFVTALHPEFSMTNVGIVFGSHRHRTREEECGIRVMRRDPAGNDIMNLLQYFEQREVEILGLKKLEEVLE